MLAAPLALAEQEYFTWVDEMGRVHNSPKVQTPAAKPAFEGYLSEEEFEKEQAKALQERPPFYTWIDGQGRLSSQTLPVADKNTANEALIEQQITDHQLLPSLRVVLAHEHDCCSQYRALFKETLSAGKALQFSHPELALSLRGEASALSAWYLYLPAFSLGQGALPELHVRLYDSQAPLGLIALDKDLKPLHYLPSLQSTDKPATWRTKALKETRIALADTEVRALIVFFPQGAEKNANFALQWQP